LDYRSVLTTCTYCGCGCGLHLQVVDGRITGTLPSKTSPVNEGKLCVKGWYIHEFVQHPKRLTKPLMRQNGVLSETSWEAALDHAAERLKSIKEAHGPDSIAFLASAKCTNEDNFVMQKLARAVVGTNNVDHCARL